MPTSNKTRQLILEAAVTCIERDGIEGVTTRKIAREAGTNIASINYHFRSKDDLLTQVLDMTIRHMLQDVVAAIDANAPFETTLREVIFYLIDGGRRFPGITRAHLQQAIAGHKQGTLSARAMRRVFERLSERAVEAYPRQDPVQVRMRLAQVLSSILFVMLAPDLFDLPPAYRATDTSGTTRLSKAYVQLFLEHS